MEHYLRNATIEDCELLYCWANDLEVRQNSFHTDRIPYEEHQKWFYALLKDETRRQYIYMRDGQAVGQIRVQMKENEAEIGYSIAQEYRCMGYGRDMVRLLTKKVEMDFPDVKKLVAEVKPTNPASMKVFMECGYEEKYRAFELNVGVGTDDVMKNRGY